MGPLVVGARPRGVAGRLERTAAILERRGYAVAPARLGELCLGGPIAEGSVRAALAGTRALHVHEGLVLPPGLTADAPRIAYRARSHPAQADRCLPLALDFVATLVRLCPFVLSVAIAGSLASGGFLPTDDVDLNLVVEDGHRHLAYVMLNLLATVHALRHRGKPTDTHTQRPLAPRFMTANLILERSQCFPLVRQDEDMAYELLASRPIFGAGLLADVVAANPRLAEHFPQLLARRASDAVTRRPGPPAWLYPRGLDRPARSLGRAAWLYMQWTRRRRPEALARVAFVRRTMRPYTLFDEGA
jgi:hypothetical protein